MMFLFKCSETAKVCDKSQYKEASILENIKLKLHLLHCKCCRNYSENNCKLTKSIKTAHIKTFPVQQKKFLKAQINKEMQSYPKT
ncbi:hypothetical protein EI546_08300 [Aequorivita sp. H23M31]|uniref:Glycine dehydrogenase n=1 Tax=Aequorivita ciconiae TaxID=2494375 RepID=A0A410G3D3_9FLAO|nr:hypothetical protein EI546_08300 [Aequorivita sp. H23M31]